MEAEAATLRASSATSSALAPFFAFAAAARAGHPAPMPTLSVSTTTTGTGEDAAARRAPLTVPDILPEMWTDTIVSTPRSASEM